MIIVNRLLNILILIFAVLSVAHGWLLFERRIELRERGEKMANAIDAIVKDLDVQSGTELQKEIHRQEITGADGKTLTGGTLGFENFHQVRDPATKSYQQFDNLMDKVKTQAHDVREQRDKLATAIAEHATLFQLGTEEDATYQYLSSYEQAVSDVYKGLESIRNRDAQIFSKIEDAANKIGFAMEKDVLGDIEKFEEPLKNLTSYISKIKEKGVNYADTIAQAVSKINSHNFLVDVDKLRDDTEYVTELTAILNDFNNINEKLKKYDKYKVEFLETKDALERALEGMASANENYAALESKLKSADLNYAKLKKRFDGLVGTSTATQSRQLNKVEGKVLNVNYDWDYVIINLGKKDSLPENLELIIARDQEYICKVLVTRVHHDYAVAEILPNVKHGNVIEGDRVIF